MPIIVRNLRLELDEPEEELRVRAAKRLNVTPDAIRHFSTVRRSLDARRRDDIHFRYQIELVLNESLSAQEKRLRRLHRNDLAWLDSKPLEVPQPGESTITGRPIVVGFGPGGMFAAIRLAELGYKPIVLERGRDVRRRHRDVLQRFYRERDFDPVSNVLYGEGGAGAYSDGKLYTRVNDPLCKLVLEILYQHGADPDILVDARPHIGSDRLPVICKRIRKRIEELGGEVLFECEIADVHIADGTLRDIKISGDGSRDLPDNGRVSQAPEDHAAWLHAGPTVLAIGHSARDTIRMLHQRGIRIDPKPFQIGVRVEHPQSLVDRWQYGASAGHRRLGAAEYHVVAKKAAQESGDVFSFCMCPGGVILPTNEIDGLIATNGASRSQRSSPFANSGLVLTVDPEALTRGPSTHAAMEGLSYLEALERLAFQTTGKSYRVPVQRASDYLIKKQSSGTLDVSYPLGGEWTDVASILPDTVADSVRRALQMLEERYPGFAGEDAMITAPETRASSPVRMYRDPATRVAEGVAGLYPVGEGAGYAGGIVSAAVDGIKTADQIIRHYAPPS